MEVVKPIFVSGSEVARAVGVSLPKLMRYSKQFEEVAPDTFVESSNLQLFNRDRLPKIKAFFRQQARRGVHPQTVL